MVDLGFLFTQVELRLRADVGILFDGPYRSGVLIHDLIFVGYQGNVGTGNGWSPGEVEVAADDKHGSLGRCCIEILTCDLSR